MGVRTVLRMGFPAVALSGAKMGFHSLQTLFFAPDLICQNVLFLIFFFNVVMQYALCSACSQTSDLSLAKELLHFTGRPGDLRGVPERRPGA